MKRTELNEKIVQLELQYGYIPSKDEDEFKNIERYKEFIQNEMTEYIRYMQENDMLTEKILNESERYVIS